MEIARRNIFEEIIGKAGSIYESAILTCFSFDPLYFIHYYLPKLNSINVTNVIVLIDASQYDLAVEEYLRYKSDNQSSIQLNFSPVRINPSFHGVFHPKIALLVGPRQCLALVGSGNLTYGGMTYNNEVWNAFAADSIEAEEAPFIASVWKYLSSLIPEQNSLREQLSWMTAYSECLKDISGITAIGNYRFLINTQEKGIGQQLIDIIGNEVVKEIKVVSPYYDNEGRAISFLYNHLHPRRFICLGDNSTGTWPLDLPDELLDHIELRAASIDGFDSRTHAKIIQIVTDATTYVLSGSANLTVAGLGLGKSYNDEAVVLIKHAGNRDFIAEMGVSEGESVNPDVQSGSKARSVLPITREVTILSCELWNGEYLLEINEEIDNVELCWKDSSGEEKNAIHFDHLYKSSSIKIEAMPKAASIVLQRGGCDISNHLLILVDDVIRNYCPDKDMKQLSRLLSMAKDEDWDTNITRVLSFVTFDDEITTSSVSHVIHRPSQNSKQPQDTIINRSDFAASALESAADRRNHRILDLLMRIITANESDNDLEESLNDDGSGDIPNSRPSSQKTKLRVCSPQRLSEIDVFLNRLQRYYSRLCKRFDDALQPIRLGEINDISRRAKSKSYSSALIAVELLYKLAKDNDAALDKIDEAVIHKRLLDLLGRFLLVFRDTTIIEEGYNAIRVQEMKQTLFVHSLVLLSHFTWNQETKQLSRLLVFNLLDLFRDDNNRLSDVIRLFEQNLKEATLSLNDNSLEETRRCIDLYLHNKTENQVIERVSLPVIIYKKRLGFLLCTKALRSRDFKDSLGYEILVHGSGFKNGESVVLQNATLLPVCKGLY